MERTVVLGERSALVGVVTEPRHGAAVGLPGVLFFNAGMLHHIGPHRLWVTMARSLAASGYTCLRFDFSGLGDSGPRQDGLPARLAAVEEAVEAMDHLGRECGLTRFILVGLCSGADRAFRVANRDSRVAGAVLADPFPYGIAGDAKRSDITWSDTRPEEWAQSLAFDRDVPPPEETRAILSALRRRDVHLLLLYSGGYSQGVKSPVELFPEFESAPWLTVERFEQCDHTFTLRAQQRLVSALISHWVAGHWPVESGDGRETLQGIKANAVRYGWART